MSDAERERRQRTLQHATNAITQELDVELVRAVIGLQVDGLTLRSDDWTVYTERVAGWHKATAAPGILRDVLLVDRGPTGLRLRRWSDDTHRFVDVAWPDDMASYRTRFATELAAWESHPPDEPLRPADLLSTDGATIVVPIAPIPVQNDAGHLARYAPVFGYTLIRLDMPYVKDEFLASLVDKHFRLEARDECRIAVVVAARSIDRPSTRPTSTTWRPSSATHDAEVDFFAFHPDQFQLVRLAADSLSNAMPTGADRRRSLFIGMTRRPATDPTASRCRSTTSRGGRWSRGTGPDRSRRPSRPRGCRNLILGFGVLLLMFAERRGARASPPIAPRVSGGSRWSSSRPSRTSCARRSRSSGRRRRTSPTASSPIRRASSSMRSRIQTEARRLGDTVERVLLYAGIEAGRGIGHRTPMAVVDARRRRARPRPRTRSKKRRRRWRPTSRRTCRRSSPMPWGCDRACRT